MAATRKGKPETIDAYLAGVSPAVRTALQKLRTTINAAAPDAEECISYEIPTFRVHGRMFMSFAAWSGHCAFYPGAVVGDFKDDLREFETSKGTIKFTPDRPLSAALVKKIVNTKLASLRDRPRRSSASDLRPVSGARSKQKAGPGAAPREDPAVSAYMRKLTHPLKPDIEAARRIILEASPDIGEGIKWNAPSFRTAEYFATLFPRSEDSVQFIFHLGAKVRDNSTRGMRLKDPRGLLTWLAKDRCIVSLGSGKTLKANTPAFRAIVREWIRYV